MKKTLLLTGVILALTASLASAAGLSLAWSTSSTTNTCPSNAASRLDISNTCDDNTILLPRLIGSIVSPGLVLVVGQAIVIDMQESGVAKLSDWWDFTDGACRGVEGLPGQLSSMSLSTSFNTKTNVSPCKNLWGLTASGATSYQGNFPSGGRAHMTGAFAVAAGQAWPVNTEWYSFAIDIDGARSIDDPLADPPILACNGCLHGACFTFNYAIVNQPAGTSGGDATLTSPAGKGQSVSYQGGGQLSCASATPARRATWGQVKSLYR